MRDLRLPLSALSAVLTAVLLAVPVMAQTTIEEQPAILAEVDAWLDANIAEIDKRQQIYLDQNRTYWQGLSTHTTELAYDEFSTKEQIAKEPDNFAAKPTDQQAGWSDIFPEFAVEKLPATIRIDVYDSPEGSGYTISLSLTYKDLLFVRTVQFGPETWREHYWTQIAPTLSEAVETR